jgi:hypothetical protein
MKKILPVLIPIILLLTLGGMAYLLRGSLRAWAFSVTGEEGLLGQVRGVGQLVLNPTHGPLRLEPDTPTNYGGVNPFGINTFLHDEVEIEKRDETLRLIAEAGFHWVREEFPWEDIEIHGRGDFADRRNDPEGIDAWAKYDNIVDLVETYDLELIVRLSNPPAWSRAGGDAVGDFAPPDDIADFVRFAVTVAERYRGRIHYYQVWNEPNIYPEWGEQIVNPEQYADLLCRTYRALKEVDPSIVVLSGTLAPTSALDGRDFNDYIFLQRMYNAGAGDCFDILTMQGYGLWSGPTDRRMDPVIVNYGRSQFIRDIMVRNGDADKAIWISEMNWNAVPDDVADKRFGQVTLEQQARYAPMAYQRAQEEWPWVGVVNFWYFKRADYSWLDSRFPQAYFQMAGPEFELMPVYNSMKAYTGQSPVMYRGAHRADHWAVSYGGGWSALAGRRMGAAAGAGPAEFRFSGSSLTIALADSADGAPFTLLVDGREVIVRQNSESMVTWRGRGGQHTVTLTPLEELTVVHYRVGQTRWAPGFIAAGAVLAAGVAGVWRWRGSRRRK